MDGAFSDAQAFSDMAFNDFMVNDLNSKSIRKARRYILASCTHLSGHGDHGHGKLTCLARPGKRTLNLFPDCDWSRFPQLACACYVMCASLVLQKLSFCSFPTDKRPIAAGDLL